MGNIEEKDIVIVGGGICGLATALALHRKGLASLILEQSTYLRASGATLTLRTNGWHALDYLGVASKLRPTAIPLELLKERYLDAATERESQLSKGEVRCIKRKDLIETLASGLPSETIRFGCKVVSLELDPFTSYPLIQLQNGSLIKAKILIGCDGVNSVVTNLLGLNPLKLSGVSAVRAFTDYPDGHGLPFAFMQDYSGHTLLGRIPLTDKLICWFITKQWKELTTSKSQDFILQSCLEATKSFPSELVEMIKHSKENSFIFTHFNYRAPWDILFGNFRKGTVTVAGDALHAMGPFLGQGGAASLEDAVVLARSLAQNVSTKSFDAKNSRVQSEAVVAIDKYLEERKPRLLKLSLQSYLIGKLLETPSLIKRLIIKMCLMALFRDEVGHTQYDCGPL